MNYTEKETEKQTLNNWYGERGNISGIEIKSENRRWLTQTRNSFLTWFKTKMA